MCLQFQMPFHERKSQSKANYKRNLAQRDEPLKTERSGLKLSQRSRRCKREKKLFQKCQQTFAGNFDVKTVQNTPIWSHWFQVM